MWNKKISINPKVCFGKPCIKGTRIPVHMVLDLLEEGLNFDQIIKDYYPDIKKEDILACIHYANTLVKNEEIVFPELEKIV